MSKNFKKMLSYYKPYRCIFWADMFFATVSAAVALAIPLVIRYVTYTLVYEDKAQIMFQIKIIAAALFAMVAADCYSKFFISNYGHVMGAKIEYNMRAEIFEHLQKLSFSFYDNQKVGQLMSRITTDLFDITELMHHGPENIILSAIKIIGAFVILVNISPLLALAAFIVLPFMFAYAYYLNGKMRRAFRQNRVKIAEINGQIEDNLSGIRVVKSFANEEIEKKKFKIGNAGFLSAKKNSYHYMGSFQAGLGAFTTLIQVNVILAGTILIANGKVNVSDLVTFVLYMAYLLYISTLLTSIRRVVDYAEQFQRGMTGIERFCEIMEIEPDIKDRADAKELTDVRGDITFEDVSFQYEENTEQVLQHINLTVPAGSYMALVGASGAGKSTLCSLIPRFYDVTEGAVKVDGTDVRDLTLKSLRDHIGIVQQDVFLFAGDIRSNIVLREEGISDEEILQVCRYVNADKFIDKLDHGLDEEVRERGNNFSAGQRQLLSFARTIIHKPSVMILDEATANIDTEAELLIQDSLEKMRTVGTMLIVAHRLSTIQHADNIIVLSHGKILEQGNHQELLAKHGRYYQLYTLQYHKEQLEG